MEIGNIHNIIPKRRGLVTLGVCDICLVFKAFPPQSSFTKQLQSTPFPPSCYSLYSTHPFPTNSPSPQIYPVPTTNERLCPNNPEPHPTLSTTTVHIASNLYREVLFRPRALKDTQNTTDQNTSSGTVLPLSSFHASEAMERNPFTCILSTFAENCGH